jgi:hypothetical protein
MKSGDSEVQGLEHIGAVGNSGKTGTEGLQAGNLRDVDEMLGEVGEVASIFGLGTDSERDLSVQSTTRSDTAFNGLLSL